MLSNPEIWNAGEGVRHDRRVITIIRIWTCRWVAKANDCWDCYLAHPHQVTTVINFVIRWPSDIQIKWMEVTWLNCRVPVAIPVYYSDVIMGPMTSQITSLTIVYSTFYSSAYWRKHQSSASLAFVWGIHRKPVNSPHKWPVRRKMFSFDDVIMHDHQATGSILFLLCKQAYDSCMTIILH